MSPLVAQSLMGGAAAFSKLPPGIGVAAPAALKGIAPLLCAPGAGNNAASVQALISQLQQASGTSAAATSLGLNPFAAANQAGLQQQALNFNPLVRFLSTRVPKNGAFFASIIVDLLIRIYWNLQNCAFSVTWSVLLPVMNFQNIFPSSKKVSWPLGLEIMAKYFDGTIKRFHEKLWKAGKSFWAELLFKHFLSKSEECICEAGFFKLKCLLLCSHRSEKKKKHLFLAVKGFL